MFITMTLDHVGVHPNKFLFNNWSKMYRTKSQLSRNVFKRKIKHKLIKF